MLQRYVILPAYGFRSEGLAASHTLRRAGPVLRLSGGSPLEATFAGAAPEQFQVLDSISEDGPKLVEMTPETELAMRTAMPEFKIVPVVKYRTMRLMHRAERDPSPAVRTDVVAGSDLRIVDASGNGLPGAKVIAFTNFRTRAGDEADSDGNGRLRLRIRQGTTLDRIYVYGPTGYWGRFQRSFELTQGATISLAPIDLAAGTLALRRYRDALPADAGSGVTIGIVDTGVARDHPLLPNISGGANLVLDELQEDPGASDDWGPAQVAGEHGTHVAGIVAARPAPGMDIAGVAPGATIRSYRVFPHTGEEATNYDISVAIDRAVRDRCDIINLSLGSVVEDEAVRAAIGAALDQGVIVIAAAGNDGRKPVRFPAALPFCAAVSAMGWVGSFPSDSSEAADVARPVGAPDTSSFVAAFSNFGPQIDLTGPGVGVVSALPGGGYGAMSGTSMACPAVAGFAAYLLATDDIISGDRNEARSRQFMERLQQAGRKIGFGRDYEGFGLPGR